MNTREQQLTSSADLVRFFQSQSIIRIIIDDAGNFGNQAANYNLILKIRQLGFKGHFEVIYFKHAKDKIINLFHLTQIQEDNFYSSDHQISFIELSSFITKMNANEVESLCFGVSGAVDQRPSNWPDMMPTDNFANALNVDVFVRFSPYYNIDDLCDTEIYLRNQESPIVQSTCDKILLTPIATFAQAKDYLNHHLNGQVLLTQQPALQFLIDDIENKKINFQPIYGWTLRESPSNLLNIILGARYAQLYGRKELSKPLVIGAFFDFDRNNIYAEKKLNIHIKNIELLQMLIFKDGWGSEYNNDRNSHKIKSVMKELNLRSAFHIASMTDSDTREMLLKLKPYEIMLVSFPSLPKTVFDGLYTHHGENIFPPVREGASTLTSLLSVTGRPHLHCRSQMDWEIKINLAEEELRNRLIKINELICRENYGNTLDFTAWEQHPLDEMIGQYIMDAYQKNSSLSNYFSLLKQDAINPNNDRILIDLTKAVELLKLPLQNSNRSVFDNENKKSKPESSPADFTIIETILSKASEYAKNIVKECPSYFPPGYPYFWQAQGREFLPEMITELPQNSSLYLPTSPNPFYLTPPK